MKKVLFFTPHGTLTGSEVLLWNFLNHYDREQLQTALYCNGTGHLFASLPADVPYFRSPFQETGARGLLARVLHHSGVSVYERAIIQAHNKVKPDCWYINTILMFHLIPLAKKLGVKTIAHINELNSLYESISYNEMAFAMQNADVVIGITERICALAKTMGAKRVLQQSCFVDLSSQVVNPARDSELRLELGINATDFVWLMIGTPNYRKGIDLLPDIVRHLKDQSCHFIWMGDSRQTGLTYLVEQQLKAFGLTNVSFVQNQVADYYNYIQLANALLLPSREEPFGNVIIDAASLGKPIVASVEGGAVEFVLPGMGELVALSTADEFAAGMRRVMSNPLAYSADLLVSRSHEYSTEVQVDIWQRQILTALN